MAYAQKSPVDALKMRPAKHLFALLFFLIIRPLGAQDVEPYVSPGAQFGWSSEGLFISFQVSVGLLTNLEPILIAAAVTLGYRIYRGGKVHFLDAQATALVVPRSSIPFAIGMGAGRASLNSKAYPETLQGSHFKIYAGLFWLGVLDSFRFDSLPAWREVGAAFTFPISLTGSAYSS